MSYTYFSQIEDVEKLGSSRAWVPPEPDQDLAHVGYAGNGLASRQVTLGLSESMGFRLVSGGNYLFSVLGFCLLQDHHVV